MLHLAVQAMIIVKQMQGGTVVAREARAVLVGHDLVAPAMHHHGRAIEHTLAQRRQALGIDRRRHEEHAAGMQVRGRRPPIRRRRDWNPPAPVRPAGPCRSPSGARAGPAVTRYPGNPPIPARSLRRVRCRRAGDLAAPGAAFLSMRKNYIPGGHGLISYTGRAGADDGTCQALRIAVSISQSTRRGDAACRLMLTGRTRLPAG